MSRVPMWVWRLACCIGLTLVVLTTTVRLTLLDANFDERAIGKADGYERIYSDVLPSPRAQAAIRQAVAGLPVDPAYVAANVRLLLPPPVLKALTKVLLAEYVDVVLGRGGSIDVDAVLKPVADNAVRLVDQLLPGTLAAAPQISSASLTVFETQVRSLVGELDRGGADIRLPTVKLDRASVARVAAIMTAGLPPDRSAPLTAKIVPLLLAGDLSAAFALVVPAYIDDATVRRIAVRADAGARLVVDALPSRLQDAAPRPLLPIGLGWLTAVGGLLTAAGLLPLLERRGRRMRESGLSLSIAVVVVVVVGWATRAIAVDPLRDLAGGDALNADSRQLVVDIDNQLRQGVTHTYVELAAIVAVAALVLLVAARVTDKRPARSPRIVLGSSAALVLAGALVVAVAPPSEKPLACNGSAPLCDRRYDQATYLTSHNAMSSSDRGFLAAGQDPDITGQLDNGVRALMLDLHYWTTPAEAEPILASLDAPTRAVLAPLVRTVESHPGVWLCHELCQIGADPATEQLGAVGKWLSSHPDEVVTLILEDDVSAADVQATITSSGLDRLLATPPAPGQPWPTLQRMIHDGHRLVVFTQRAGLTTGPIRNFYDYGAETPFEAGRISALSCAPGRGAASAPLFLINNWVTSTLPSRSAALAVNDETFLLDRVRRCQQERGLHATFVAVDFAQVGRPLQVVDELNAVPLASRVT
jgi:hypothetical protein